MTPERLTDTVTLYEADCLDVLPTLKPGSVDAVITDPPYSSGGMTRGDRMQTTSAKYVQTGSERYRTADFAGDNRDQRSWEYWCRLWLAECLIATRPGGYLLAFSDWRQLPTLTDAVQAAGWVWRGILSWDKGPSARAAAPHYFRHQCEYVVWGTRGACPPRDGWPLEGEGCYPGAYDVPVKQVDKHHMVGKPTKLMRELMRCVPPRGLVLDPFAGSGTTLVAAMTEGKTAIGCEIDAGHCDTIRRRVRECDQTAPGTLFAHLPDLFTEAQPHA
jgi:site-specific DNA-methyltransferase (adenine-specific)